MLRGNGRLKGGGSAINRRLLDGNTWGWFENDTAYMTLDGSNAVSEWVDKLGSGRKFVQATGASQPIQSADGVLFDGTDDTMALTSALSIPVTVYLVMQDQAVAVVGSRYVFDGLTANSMACIRQSNGTGSPGKMHIWKGSYLPINGYSADTNNAMRPTLPFLLTGVFNGASSELRINEKTAFSGDTGTFGVPAVGGMTIGSAGGGGSSFTNAYYKEIIVRSVVDDAATQDVIRAYLLAKHRKELPLHLLIGQSNAGGQDLTANADAAYQAAFANGMIYDNLSSDAWETYDPSAGGNAQTTVNCFGLENSLLRDLYTSTSEKHWMVKYAVSNTALYQGANPGGGADWHPDTVSGQFDNTVAVLADAVNWLEPGVVAPIFKSITWMQGEGDTTNATWANAYYANLVYFMTEMSAAVVSASGQATTPQVVIGRITSEDGTGGAVVSATVKAAQDLYASTYDVPLINTDSYSLMVDNIHYDAAGLVQFGSDVADALISRGAV